MLTAEGLERARSVEARLRLTGTKDDGATLNPSPSANCDGNSSAAIRSYGHNLDDGTSCGFASSDTLRLRRLNWHRLEDKTIHLSVRMDQ